MKKVLILEDNASLLDEWQERLERDGLGDRVTFIPVHTPHDGAKALAEQGPFDLVAVDGTLQHEGDGADFIGIHVVDKHRGPILAISSSPGMNDLMRTIIRQDTRSETRDHGCEKKYAYRNILNLLGIKPH